MTKRKPNTETMKISDVKATLSRLVNAVYRGETRALIEKSGIPVAALVSADNLARLEQLDREWEAGTRALERFSQAIADVPVDELEAKIDQIIAERRQVLDAMREPFRRVSAAEIEREAAKADAEVRADMAAERQRSAKTA